MLIISKKVIVPTKTLKTIIKTAISLNNLKLIIAVLVLLTLVNSFGLSSDNTQQANYIADTINFNHITGTTIFIGHVKMDQGTTHLIGDKVIVYRLPSGRVKEVIALGNLAHYSTLPDNQTKILDAYAKRIEYYPNMGIAILIDQGEIMQGLDTFKGPYIVYDTNKQIITSTLKGTKVQSVIVVQPQHSPTATTQANQPDAKNNG